MLDIQNGLRLSHLYNYDIFITYKLVLLDLIKIKVHFLICYQSYLEFIIMSVCWTYRSLAITYNI